MSIAFMYAGQGSQKKGMGQDMSYGFPTFNKVLDEMNSAVDFDLRSVMFNDPDGSIDRTKYTQPCMAAFAAGVTAVLKENGIIPEFAAGQSLGEYSALHAAGVFSAEQLAAVTAFRGSAMEDAGQGTETGMYAVLGMEEAALHEICAQASEETPEGDVFVSNLNAKGQIVISGEIHAADRARELASENGARRCIRLNTSGAFHTPYTKPAADKLGEYLRELMENKNPAPEIPVIFNATAAPLPEEEAGAGIIDLLIRQIQSPVRMQQTIEYLKEHGVTQVIEIGPGKTIAGFVKKTVSGIEVDSIDSAEDLRRVINKYRSRRTALVTGGSRGIGRAIAVRLAKEGFDVAVGYVGNLAAAEETVQLCKEAGAAFDVKAAAVKGDVADSAQCTQIVQAAREMNGRLDVLVNNAGINRDTLLMRTSDEDLDAVMKACLYGTFYCTREASRSMLRQKYGRIINISSVVGMHGNAGQANYSAAKAGIIGLTKSAAKEFAGKNITVNAVAPGFIETEMTLAMSERAREQALTQIPSKKVGSPEDIAAAVAFLAGEDGSYITGQVICVDGGMGI